VKIPFFADAANAEWLSLALQTIAGLVGFLTAQADGINVLTAFSATSAGHVIAPATQAVGEAATTEVKYLPFVNVPRATRRLPQAA